MDIANLILAYITGATFIDDVLTFSYDESIYWKGKVHHYIHKWLYFWHNISKNTLLKTAQY